MKNAFTFCISHVFKYSQILLSFLCITGSVAAQTPAQTSINRVIAVINEHAAKLSIEEVYLQTDKSYYTAGDTLWFKAYLLEAASLNSSFKSGVLYAEIVSDSNRVIKRMMLPLYGGLAAGNIVLDDKEIPQGGYNLIAYTNWMRNMGEQCYFKKHFYVAKSTEEDWLIDYNARVVKEVDKDKVELSLRVNQFDKVPVMVREMQMRLTDGRRTWFKGDVQTDLSGLIKVNFNLPEKADTKNLSFSLQDMRKGSSSRQLLVPVLLNRPENTDLQFMPEGGSIIAGLPVKIAFKAIGENGLGTTVSGNIYDSKALVVASFASAYKGIGAFTLIPVAGEKYTAKIKLTDGTYKSYPLPAVNSTGLMLKVDNKLNTDSCEVLVYAAPDMLTAGNTYYLTGMAKGSVCYGASFTLHNKFARFRISKKIFPSGIVHFVISSAQDKPLNERMIYIDHQDQLRIKITANKASYMQRDSVALNVEVTNEEGAPVQGSFSLSVTDDGQVKTDSISGSNIITNLLLTANLKGTVETPGYYASALSSAQKWQQLDFLLLTQGWVGYNWQDAFKPAQPLAYAAEKEYLITGRVTNMFNKPVAGSGIMLFSKKPTMIVDTVSNEKGIFTFKGIYPADTAVYFIQARNKKGKSYNVGIEMDEFKPPVFTASAERMIPWYVNVDSTDFLSVEKQVRLKNEQQRITRGTVLKAVEVRAKKIIKGSKNINGPGEADIIIDEEELAKAGRTSLGDLLTTKIKGFGLRTKKLIRNYQINDMLVHLIIDGIELDFYYDGTSPRDEFYRQYLDYYDAEEIKGIEVMKSGKYQMNYTSTYIDDPMAVFYEHSFIEVTTRSGHGPFLKKAVGTYVYRPTPFTLPKLFYTPKYKASATPDMTDIRSTIHWEPNMITDKNGKATVIFYTADNIGSYSIIMEGTDMNGGLGVKRSKIEVKRNL